MSKDILVSKNGKTYVNVPYLEAYIPDEYYSKSLVEHKGELIHVFGLFNFATGTPDGKITSKMKLFKFPSFIVTKPSFIDKKQMNISNSGDKIYHIFKYYKDDVFLESNTIVQGLNNVDKFIKLINAGKTPDGIRYDDLLSTYIANLNINNMDLGISAKIIELKLAEICRVKGDPDTPFRKGVNANPKLTMYDYEQLNLRYLAMASSTFSAVTFEDIDSMILNSINKKRYNRVESESPVEKIMKY